MATKRKKAVKLSPASFVTLSSPEYTNNESYYINELITRDDPMHQYDAYMQEMRGKFNDTYYRFLSKMTVMAPRASFLQVCEDDFVSLFDDLLEMREMLEEKTPQRK